MTSPHPDEAPITVLLGQCFRHEIRVGERGHNRSDQSPEDGSFLCDYKMATESEGIASSFPPIQETKA